MAIARRPASSTGALSEAAAEKFISGAGKAPEPPDEKRMLPTMIRMEKDLRDRIDAAAKASGLGRSAWIRFQCIKALDEGK